MFENSTIFQHFNTFINGIETVLRFQDNLVFKGKIVTKFPHTHKKKTCLDQVKPRFCKCSDFNRDLTK